MSRKKVATKEEILQSLLGLDILKDEEHVQIRKPTHGNCCTCQTCGLPHDECEEFEMLDRNKFRAKFLEAIEEWVNRG